MSQNKPKWRVRLPREGKMGGVEVLDGDKYVCTMSHHPAERQMAKDYAARIVACVNACEGIPTEVLENTVQRGGAMMYQQERRKTAEHQRDELLAALSEIAGMCEAISTNNPRHFIRKAALEAIASAKGGAA